MDPHGYAAQPRRAQKYSTRNVKQQPLTRWWAHTNIPRAYLMLQANTHDQSLGQEIIGEFPGVPRREHFGLRPAGSDDSTFKDLLHPQTKQKTQIFD